jgi:hypothetical protein
MSLPPWDAAETSLAIQQPTPGSLKKLLLKVTSILTIVLQLSMLTVGLGL